MKLFDMVSRVAFVAMLCNDLLKAVRNVQKYGIFRYIGDLENGKMGLYCMFLASFYMQWHAVGVKNKCIQLDEDLNF